DQSLTGAALPSGVQYYVLVCDPADNAVAGRLLASKLGDKVFDEEDFNDTSAPKPTALAIPHGDGKPSANDTVTVTFSQPLAEASMCSTWGADNTKDQTLAAAANPV